MRSERPKNVFSPLKARSPLRGLVSSDVSLGCFLTAAVVWHTPDDLTVKGRADLLICVGVLGLVNMGQEGGEGVELEYMVRFFLLSLPVPLVNLRKWHVNRSGQLLDFLV